MMRGRYAGEIMAACIGVFALFVIMVWIFSGGF